MRPRFPIFVLIAATLAVSCAAVKGVTLDWDAATWAPGSLSNSYNVDPANPGNDITVSVAPTNGATLMADGITGASSPTINNTLAGGMNPVQNSLKISADLSGPSWTVVVTIDFSAFYPLGVQGVSFTIFDIDLNGSSYRGQDQIRSITASNGTTTFAPTITGVGLSVTPSGSDFNQVLTGNADAVDTGASSNRGNATISFGSQAVTSVTFTWMRGPDASGSGPIQSISLHDINFTPVPEINPALASILSCFGAIGLALHHRSRVRARRK